MVQTESGSEDEASSAIQLDESAETDRQEHAKWKESYLASQYDDELSYDSRSRETFDDDKTRELLHEILRYMDPSSSC